MSPAMDQKDHFEHLRTVHFSLVATCLLLLVVSTTSQNRTLERAEEQLDAMQSVVVHWSEFDFESEIDRQVKSTSTSLPASKALRFAPPAVNQLQSYLVDFIGPAWSPIANEDCVAWLYDPMIKRQPRTLSDAHQLWDCLHTANTVAIPFAFSAEQAVIRGQKVPLDSATASSAANHVRLTFTKTSEDQRAEIRTAFGISVEYAFVGVLYPDKGPFVSVMVPVEKARVITVNLTEPLRSLKPMLSLDPGTYKQAFSDLDEITMNYDDLTFDKLKTILSAQRKHSDQTFEAFSVKFPSDAVARWGLILLLGIQLYFLIHMSAPQLQVDTEVSVAWIPLYSNIFSQAVFVFTIAVLPPVTAGIVGHVGSITGQKNIDIVVVVLAVSSSMLLAWLTLRSFAQRFSGPLVMKMAKMRLFG
jgi:hypothetical protein